VAQQSQRKAVMRLSGEMTVRTIAGAHRKLAAKFKQSDVIVADTTKVSALDLTLVQLLICARRTALKQGKTFTLSAPASGALLETLKRGGFVGAPENEDTAFWLQATGNDDGCNSDRR
jgi:ABC-type transporter Mla MlaB component